MDYFEKYKQQTRWQFSFHGSAGQYFMICLTNLVLCIITCGIYIPWAMVRSRRYIYKNMELNGARFGYHATGFAIFLSWLLCVALFVVITLFDSVPLLQFCLFIAFILMLPILMAKSIKYNAMMTTLNNVRFDFRYSAGRAWWVMMGLPLVLYILLTIVAFLIVNIPGSDPYSLTANITKGLTAFIVFFIGSMVIAGVLYAKWLALLGEGGQFGLHRFAIAVSVKHCIKVCVLSMLIVVPFMALIIWLFFDIFRAIMMASMMGGMGEEAQVAMMLHYRMQITACYLLYLVAILLSAGYLWMGLRNHFMNNLTLANGAIRFHSDIAFYALVMQWFLIGLASVVTLGLAYPLMKIRYLRFLAANTWVEGDLDTLELADYTEQPERGVIALLSRGMMPQIPFI